MPDPATERLRLLAQDPEDLAILSAHMQDASVRVGNMAWLPKAAIFALVADRFDWVAAEAGRCERCQTGLHFAGVARVQVRGFDPLASDTLLSLIGMVFTETDAPAGTVDLVFEGGAAVRLDVECLEAQLRDLGPRWQTEQQPGHADDGDPQTT